jgi:hypothetical protein
LGAAEAGRAADRRLPRRARPSARAIMASQYTGGLAS